MMPNWTYLTSKGLRTAAEDPKYRKRFVRPRIWLVQRVLCPHPDFFTRSTGDHCSFCLRLLKANDG